MFSLCYPMPGVCFLEDLGCLVLIKWDQGIGDKWRLYSCSVKLSPFVEGTSSHKK